MMPLGIVGWSGSGKTTLVVALVPELQRRGLRVSTIKHTHHAVDLDRPGKDTYRHREAGAVEVMLASSSRWVLMHELRDAPAPSLDQMLGRLAPVDLVLIEGFKALPCAKIEVHRGMLGKPLLQPDDTRIVAIATTDRLPRARVPVLALDRPDQVAAFIADWLFGGRRP